MDVAWNEADIHVADGDEVLEKNAVFQLFATEEEEEELFEYTFKNIPGKISLRGQTACATSTGLAVWSGAEVMAEHLAENPELVRHKSVLELGAGLGLCGLVVHRLGATNVICSDGDVDVLKRLRVNLKESGIGACPQLIWGKDLPKFEAVYGKFQVIIACDCGYISRSVMPMWETVNTLLSVDGVFLYVHVSSSQFEPEFFEEEATIRNFSWTCASNKVYTFRRR